MTMAPFSQITLHDGGLCRVSLGMLIVDPLSGAMFTLDSDKVDMVLESLGSKNSKADGSLTIVNVSDVPAEVMQFAVGDGNC